ncbi:hypothetical protein QBC39DRAFT_269865 [Podospora conica]|nr:hypothetical protein QBC39DRAFT_269865 [Schizothecium conicum]
MATSDDPMDPIAVVKQWLAEREARPNTLTPTELNAIITLKGTLGRIPEPELGIADWVSLMHKYRDARQQQNGTGFEFEEMTNADKSFSTICIFTGEMGATPMRFPGEYGGLLPVDHSGTPGVPSFLKKKDAKRYAAKCCIEWLMANGYMPADGSTTNLSKFRAKPFRVPSAEAAAQAAQPDGDVRMTSNSTTVSPRGNATPTEPTGDKTAPSRSTNGTPRSTNGTPGPTNGVTTTLPPTPTPTPPEEESGDGEVPATQRVKELCETLGICQPQYVITPSLKHGRDFFDGRINFLADDPYFEDDVGRVYGGYTKKGTRERVAEQVLVALLEIQAKREASYQAILGEDARD